ncbi:MAG TPA: YIP1 family protein [Candidatus Acidoferrales bacterium]|nr:YIP1 family protein [Candidatus Acidoferrales bacterium]
MATTTVAPAPDQQPAKIGTLGRIFGVFFSPGETFADVARKPSWIAPLLLITLINLSLNIVLANRVDWISVTQKQIEKSKFAAARFDQLNDQQKAAAYTQQAAIAKITRYVAGVLAMPFLALLGGLVYMGAFNVLGGASIKYSMAFTMAIFAHLPVALHDLLAIPIALMKDPAAINPQNVVASNVGALLGPDAPLWQQALGQSIDIFGIWAMILVAIAFTAANPRKLTFGKSIGIVLTVYAVFALIGVGIASIFS